MPCPFSAVVPPTAPQVPCQGGVVYGAECSVSCGGGVRVGVFVVTQPASGGGSNCTAANGTTVTASCNTQSCGTSVHVCLFFGIPFGEARSLYLAFEPALCHQSGEAVSGLEGSSWGPSTFAFGFPGDFSLPNGPPSHLETASSLSYASFSEQSLRRSVELGLQAAPL